MNSVEKVKQFFKEESMLLKLLKIIGVLLIIYLVSLTWNVWTTILSYALTALKPFIYGFVIAYILHPLVQFLEKKGLKKSIAIVLIIVVTLVVITWIALNLFPMFYEEFGLFLNSINSSIEQISKWYFDNTQDPSGVLAGIIKQLESSFGGIQNTILDVMKVFITNFISTSLNIFTTMLFSITIALYMLSDFQGFKNKVKKLSSKISPKIPLYLEAIDVEMGHYVRSTLILMLVYFVEYTSIYFILGHKGYLMIGILYVVIGTLVPYVGGMIVTAIGILTGLTLPKTNLILLIVLVMVASQVDGYVTSPFIYKKGVKVEPLASLLIVFIGSAVFGVVGVMLAMPVYVSLRAIGQVNKASKEDVEEELSEATI